MPIPAPAAGGVNRLLVGDHHSCFPQLCVCVGGMGHVTQPGHLPGPAHLNVLSPSHAAPFLVALFPAPVVLLVRPKVLIEGCRA